MNDEILKKMNKISNIEGLPSNTIVSHLICFFFHLEQSTSINFFNFFQDSKSAQNSKKVSIDCKDIRQDLVRNADMAQEKEKKSKKIKKDVRLTTSSVSFT